MTDARDTPAADEVAVYSTGLVCCSVCVPAGMDREIVERRVNAATPSGIPSHWRIADEPFSSGKASPTPCNTDSTRLHYLLTC